MVQSARAGDRGGGRHGGVGDRRGHRVRRRASPPAAAVAPRFVADAGGIDHRYEGDFQYFVGGGVAAFDCDDDGRSELYFAGGSGPAALYRNDSPIGGALRFTAVPSPVTDLTAVTGAYPLDIDSDGHTDLAVLRVGQDEILRGLGDCRFERADEALGIDDTDTWTVAFSATWEGTNDLPTLAFGGYLAPDRQSCADGRLVRPAAAGDGYDPPIALTPGYCTLSMLFSDWSRSGRRDLRVTNDRQYYRDGSDQLWRIVPGEAPRLYTEADGWRPLQLWGMGIASQDVTGDGYPRCSSRARATTSCRPSPATGTSRPTRTSRSARGVTAHRPFTGGDVLPSTAWHDEFADVNNDGVADLFIAKGNVEAEEGYATRDPNNLLIGQADGTFVEGRGDGRDRQLRAGAGRRGRRPQPRRHARPRRRQPHAHRPSSGATSAAAMPNGPSRWAPGRRSACTSRRPTSTPSARGSRPGSATARRSTRSRSAVATPAASSAGSTSASATPSGRRSASSGPTARPVRG